jgi:CubicO group peptidase (beta-lactamase class C family)
MEAERVADGYDRTGRLGPVVARLERFVADEESDGAALAVAVDGEPVAEWYAGDARPGVVAGPEVLWPLASISKLYTAATVMAMVERGDLYLAMRPGQILSGFDTERGDQRGDINLRHLLTHSSGLIYESPNMEELLIDQAPLDDIIAEGMTYPLQFAPGAGDQYSDYGFLLLGEIAATVTSVPFPDLVRDLILEPAGLRSTSMQPEPTDFSRIAQVPGSFGWGTDGSMYNSPYALRLGHPAFGVVASLNDLLHFGLLFARGGTLADRRVLAPATVSAMTSNHTTQPGMPPRGLGFMLNPSATAMGDLLSPSSYGHGGASGCTLVVDPDAGVTIAFVSNRHVNAAPETFYRRISIPINLVLAALT